MNTTSMIPPTLSVLGPHIHDAAERHGMLPFSEYLHAAYAATVGIDTVVGLLRRDATLREAQHNGAPVLSSSDTDSLLALVQFAARSLHQNADSLRDWADSELAPEIDR